jgi:hypothetical protein
MTQSINERTNNKLILSESQFFLCQSYSNHLAGCLKFCLEIRISAVELCFFTATQVVVVLFRNGLCTIAPTEHRSANTKISVLS